MQIYQQILCHHFPDRIMRIYADHQRRVGCRHITPAFLIVDGIPEEIKRLHGRRYQVDNLQVHQFLVGSNVTPFLSQLQSGLRSHLGSQKDIVPLLQYRVTQYKHYHQAENVQSSFHNSVVVVLVSDILYLFSCFKESRSNNMKTTAPTSTYGLLSRCVTSSISGCFRLR